MAGSYVMKDQELYKKKVAEYYQNPNICQECNSIIKLNQTLHIKDTRSKKFCSKSCYSENRSFTNDKTKDELYAEFGPTKGGSRIRTKAHNFVNSSGYDKKCAVCGYDKYVEVHHIKAIRDFEGDCTTREINDPSNLLLLCPNHHAELDAGYITIDDIQGGGVGCQSV